MKVIPLPALTDNYIWLIVDEESLKLIAIDPGEAAPLIHYLKENCYHLEAIFLTHHHADHVGGVLELLNSYQDIAIYGPNDPKIPFVRSPLKENAKFKCLNLTFDVLGIPGHTASHLCFYQEDNHWLFCGDTLFSAGCGRVFDGSLKGLFESIMKLRSLPDNTLVYCAHEYTKKNLRFAEQVEPQNKAISTYLNEIETKGIQCTLPSTIGKEKQINPFFRVDELSLKNYAKYRGCSSLDPFSVFSQIRKDKDGF